MKKASDDLFIQAAIHIAAQVGIENIRTKQIADYTGFSEATLFRAFGTKEDILRSAFLHIDKNITDIFLRNEHLILPDTADVYAGVECIWHMIYRYLLANKDETLFLIKYRYSSLYTNEVRNCRLAFNGSVDKAYRELEKKFGPEVNLYKGFIFNCMFEMTLVFAEKIVTGRLSETPENEKRIWTAIVSAVKSIIGQKA